MKIRHTPGFTIIEVILVLAITTALAIGIMAGSNIAINQARYDDALTSFRGMLQQEYVATTRATNNSEVTSCDVGTADVDDSPTPTLATPRGASECVLLGRFINVDAGTKITTGSVVAARDMAVDMPDTDIDALQSYRLAILASSTETANPPWQTVIVDSAGAPETFGVLLLRSPVSGSVLTFINDGAQLTSGNMETAVNLVNVKPKMICIDPTGLFTGGTFAVKIQEGASNPSGVQLMGIDSVC